MQQLKVGSSLQGGKYKIEKVLGQGGFGITYLATQELLDRKVCIKEFFFKEYCERDEATSQVSLGTQSNHELVERFMAKFLKEARTISQLEHPHIIRIHDIFKENNTAYYVMEYIEGESLADRVNHYGCLPESEAVEYIKQVASALDFIHQQSINHLDVKPANIMIRKSDNKAVLIDFGLSKQYDAQGGQTSTTPVGISHGYAPMEQYNVGGVSTFSPQTDIYSLGATLYKLVTGNTPPQAVEVLNDGLPELPFSLSSKVKNSINQSMQVRKKDRPEDVKAFLNLMNTSNTSVLDEGTKLIQPQMEPVMYEATMILDKPEVKEQVYSSRSVDDTPKPTNSFESKEKEGKKKRSYISILIGAVGITIFTISQLNKGESVMTNNVDVITKELNEKNSILHNNDETSEIRTLSLQEKAQNGDSKSQYELGKQYNIEGDNDNAEKWYRKAAEQGHTRAQYGLAYIQYIKKNHEEALKWYGKAAEKGDADALFSMYGMYERGIGVKADFNKAMEFLLMAAEKNNRQAIFLCGWHYCYTLKDYQKAITYFMKLPDDSRCLEQLGYCYFYGYGVEKDLSKAKMFLEKSGVYEARMFLEKNFSN